MKKYWKILLASQSPRRKLILKEAGFKFIAFTSNSSESFDENLTFDKNLKAIAQTKVQATLETLSPRKLKGFIIIAADTMVFVGKTPLGKPKNRADAMRMLRLLSGKRHQVKTAFTLFCPDQGRGVTRVVTTHVGFRKLSTQELNWYVDTDEPYDKAGGYALQGLAAQFVQLIEGDFLNVVGLPINEVQNELRKQGWHVHTRRNSKRSKKNSRR